jgi:hypothetical protein
LGATGFNSVGGWLRMSTPATLNGYMIAVEREDGSYVTRVYQVTASNFDVTIASDSGETWSPGDTLLANVSGTAIKVYRNEVEIISTTDATWSSGRIGLNLFSNNALTDAILDNLRGGDGDGITPPPPGPTTAPSLNCWIGGYW